MSVRAEIAKSLDHRHNRLKGQAHAGWARAIASLVVFALLLTSLVAMLAVRRSVAPAFAFIAAACVYATWVLLRRFA